VKTKLSQTEVKFIVDAMLGSLARWLRFLGFDTWFCATQTDDEILNHIGNRVLLTRDKELISRAQHRGFTVVNPGYRSIRRMLQKLQDDLNITFVADPLVSRCAECNTTLKTVTRKEVSDKVPLGSLSHHDTFWQCLNVNCQKVYWQGRHWTRIKKTLAQLETD
jgi:uncharacterized protein with PIN domain